MFSQCTCGCVLNYNKHNWYYATKHIAFLKKKAGGGMVGEYVFHFSFLGI